MQQRVMNLAVNARDAMPGGGELHIDLRRIRVVDRKEAPLPEVLLGDWVRVTVKDTGAGIPSDVLPHVFDPFFTTKSPGEGTGLGLAQVWGIAKQHHGHIDVATAVGEGTTFILYLPALAVVEPETEPEEEWAVIQGQGETILVVEDNLAMRQALVDSLELLNYRALQAANGREALTILEEGQKKIALVLSDVVMPEMGGMALFHAMRQRNLLVPVVMLTGHPMAEELGKLQAQGLKAWMLKPPSPEQLAQTLAQALRERPGRELGL
jgi:two-component system cell cycle sensor histidine kinase/response regulator CckA